MSGKVSNLTEKEKAALRLLLGGHDAKSSARQLGLSHHTVNDRLRSARRKLEVSSSREAARILGEAEGETPQNLVHTQFGIADASGDPDDGSNANARDGMPSEPVWHRKGVLIMTASITLAVAAISIFALQGNPEQQPETSPTQLSPANEASSAPARGQARQSDAEVAAREWLGLVDEGDAEASRVAAGEALRARHNESMWELGIALRKNNWGVPLRRNLISSDVRSARQRGATGEFNILTFRAEFSSEPEVIEIVTMERIEGEWVVIGYEGDPVGEN